MKNRIITASAIVLCALMLFLYISGRNPQPKRTTPDSPGFMDSSKSHAANTEPVTMGTEPVSMDTEPQITQPNAAAATDSAVSDTSDTAQAPEAEAATPVTSQNSDSLKDAPTEITAAAQNNTAAAETETAPTAEAESPEAIAQESDERDSDIVDLPPEADPEEDDLPEIYETAEHQSWRYDIRSFDISDTLPEGITLSDTVQQFGTFDSFDENGFLTERGDEIAAHLSQDGEYDGYLDKSYCWATLRFDLTNLAGQDDYITVGNMNLSFGNLKKVKYAGRTCKRYENSVPVGYMNMHDYMDMIPKEMQYYVLHFNPDETKQLIFCYLIEKKYKDESFYLEMNIHNDGESFDWIKLN